MYFFNLLFNCRKKKLITKSLSVPSSRLFTQSFELEQFDSLKGLRTWLARIYAVSYIIIRGLMTANSHRFPK